MIASLWCLIFRCSTITAENVIYRVYKESIAHYVEIQSGNAETLYKNLDPLKPTTFYIHGWKESCGNVSAIEIAEAVFSHGGHNICCLDWSAIADSNYLAAAPNVQEIAKIFSTDIGAMCDMGFDPKSMNVFGFSLGAHIAGGVGKNLQDSSHPNIGVITALDPAMPLFDPQICPDCRRLESNDADFVCAIHTSGGFHGIMAPIGHLDIYPNRGTPIQNGCSKIPATLDPNQIMPTYRCSHDRSWQFCGDSIRNPKTHMGIECDSVASFDAGSCTHNKVIVIGMDMPKNISGTFYYVTNAEYPYGQGLQGTLPLQRSIEFNVIEED